MTLAALNAPDLTRGGYHNSGRPESNSDSDSLYSIASSTGSLDDPIPETNMSGEQTNGIPTPAPAPAQNPTSAPTPAPAQAKDGEGGEAAPRQPLFQQQDPENVQPVKNEAPFTTEEWQAAHTLFDAAEVEPERLKTMLAGFMRINRNFAKGEEALDKAQNAGQYRDIIKFNMQYQATG